MVISKWTLLSGSWYWFYISHRLLCHVVFAHKSFIVWDKYHVIYDPRVLYVVGLAFSRSLTNYAICNVLAWYFTYHRENLAMSAILSNIHDSLSSVLVIFMANAADSYVGRFHTLLFSSTAYIGGLMLLLMLNPYDVKWLIVITLVFLALGTSGDQLSQKVFVDLVNGIDKSQDKTEERSIARAETWSNIASALAAFFSITVSNLSWEISFLICIVTMTISLLIFCTGHDSYHQGKLTERPVEVFFRVLHRHIKKLLKRNSRRVTNFSRLDGSLHGLGTESRKAEGITQERSPLSVDTKGKEASGRRTFSNQDDKVVVKRLLRMFPMWASFLVVYLISATGSTFFLQQFSNQNLNSDTVVQFYDLTKVLFRFAIPIMYSWILRGLGKNEKVKIGAGMICGIGSCVFAWKVEAERLKRVNDLDDKDVNTSISFLSLVPQFCMLGGMEGLTGEGLLEFYKSQVKDETLQSYGEEYIEVVTGFGTFLNIMLILYVKTQVGWFGDTVNDSRLDKYYRLLVFVFLANFIIYCLLARYYYKDAERHQDLVNDDLINQGLELLPCNNLELDNQPLANDEQVQENQLLGNDDKEQDNQLVSSDDQKQDNQLLPNDGLEQDNQLSANDDQEQDNQFLPNDDQLEQDNQLLPNDDHKKSISS